MPQRRPIPPARKGGNPHRTPPPRKDTCTRRRRCRHCKRAKYIQRRGLCNACYESPEVRKMYPSTSPRGKRYADKYSRAPLPEPTDAPPGSPAKVAVLEERFRHGKALWHPADAPMDVESRRLGVDP